jgi:hypothetical protein
MIRTIRSYRRKCMLRQVASPKSRLFVERLEDRVVPDAGQWFAVFNGVAGAPDINQQTELGKYMLHSAGLQDQDVSIIQAVDLSGGFLIQTPTDVSQPTLTSELQAVPGFNFVTEYELPKDGGEEDDSQPGGDLMNWDYINDHGGPADYNDILSRQKNGQIPNQGGPPPNANDVQTNNNAGSNANGEFTHSETTVVASGNNVVVGFNDSGSFALGTNQFTGFAFSTDGGNTFTDGGALPISAFGDAGDPVMAINTTTNRVYYSTLQFTGTSLDVFHSDNFGQTWSAPASGAPGKSGTQDKEWIAVDNFAGSGNGNVYLVERDFGGGNGIYFFKSTDNGNTFGPNGGTAIALAGATQGAFVTVAPDHSVEVFWFNGSVIQMRKSVDQGVTFGPTVTVVSGLIGGVNGDLGLTGIRNGTVTPAGFRSSEFPHAAVNPVSGNIYVTFANKGAGTDKADVFLTQSTDGGATWSVPIKVNDDVTTTDQWQPTIAVTPGGDKLGIFYYSRQEDPSGNNLFKYYGRIAAISGSTLNFAPSFAVSNTASLPEFGRDNVVNSVYMGDYNTAYATAGAFNVSWSDNRNTLPANPTIREPDVFFNKVALGLAVTTTIPAVGSVVFSQPTTFTVNVTDPVDPATLQASDFTVNGIAATSVSYTPGTTTMVFTYASTPVTSQGLQTMHINAGAFDRAGDEVPVNVFDGTFRYDAVLLQVVSTNPPFPNGIFTLPGPFTYDVNFNEAVDPTSVQTTDLQLSGIPGAFVSGVTVLPGNTTARFTLSGFNPTTEGALTANIAAGAITDAFGNPGAAFTATYQVDIGTVPYPTPLTSENPKGSLIYDPSVSGVVNFAGDTDSFTLNVNAGQTITVLLRPTSPGLQPSVLIKDPSNVTIASVTAAAAGQNALIQTVTAATSGTYTFTVSGAGGTVGNYNLRVTLNAALETEGLLPGDNNTLANAQNIDGSAVTLQTLLSSAKRLGVQGTTDNSNYSASAVTPTFEDIHLTGTGTLFNTDDSTNSVTIPFGFTFYGNTYTTVFYSTNALITFGSANSEFTNQNLTNDPTQAAIAPYWDDLECFSSGGGAVYYQVIGSGANQHLTLEWYNMHHFFGSPGLITFEAQLYADGRIQFNYQSLATLDGNDNGASATVGVKDAGSQGANRLLLAFNNGPNAFVGSNQSTLITPPNPTPDFYSFTATAGESLTLAIKALATGSTRIDLLNSGGIVIASGVGGSTNLDQVISNFVVSTTDTYYARVNGSSLTPYDLVVMRNATFDTEPNDTFATAQPVGNQGALGAITAGANYQASVLTPTFEDISATGTATLQNTDDSTNTLTAAQLGSFAFPFFGTTYTSLSYSTNALITFGSPNGEFTNQDMTTDPGQAAIAPYWDDLECFTSGNGAVYWQVIGSGANQHLTIEWQNMHYFFGSPGLITFEAQLYADGRIQFNYQNLVGGVFNDNGASATVGIKDAGTQGPNRLVLDFNSGPNQYVNSNRSTLISQPPSDDWYAVTLAGDQTALRIDTSTPSDGPGAFHNTLNPHIELYDPSGTLIASGITQPDGRNEFILDTGLAAGTYKIRVLAEAGTTGEYFLGVDALRTPTITITVDDTGWTFHAYGAGWSTTPGGFGGSEHVHAGGGTGSNFAQWQYGQNVTAGNSYEIFATWVANPANATNATYKIYDGATLLTTVTVDQTRSPNTGLVGGTLVQKLYTFVPATSGFHVIRVQLSDNANGNIAADAVFDPPLVEVRGPAAAVPLVPSREAHMPLAPIFVDGLRPALGALAPSYADLVPAWNLLPSSPALATTIQTPRLDVNLAPRSQPSPVEQTASILDEEAGSVLASVPAQSKPKAGDLFTDFLEDDSADDSADAGDE